MRRYALILSGQKIGKLGYETETIAKTYDDPEAAADVAMVYITKRHFSEGILFDTYMLKGLETYGLHIDGNGVASFKRTKEPKT